jgi:hypothetical protein
MKTKNTKYPSLSAKSPMMLNDALPPTQEREESEDVMVRTQIYLSRAEHQFVQAEAARQGMPMAAVIRSFIDQNMALPDDAWVNNAMLAAPADPSFVGPEDGVINHDHYIYGTPKKWVKQRGKWVEAPALPEDYHTNEASRRAYDQMIEESK